MSRARAGERVVLAWDHEYVTAVAEGAGGAECEHRYPERTVTRLEADAEA